MTTKVDTELGHKSYKKTQMKSAHWFVTDHENVQNLHILCSFENVLKTLKKKKVIKMNSCFVILCLLFFFSWILTPTTKSLCVLMCDILWISTKMTNLWYRNLFSFRWLIEALKMYIYIYIYMWEYAKHICEKNYMFNKWFITCRRYYGLSTIQIRIA